IIKRALDPDPEQRYLDAAQMLRALTGETVPRPPATPPPMTAGEYDVLVHDVIRLVELVRPGRPPIVRVLDRLGAEAGPECRWWVCPDKIRAWRGSPTGSRGGPIGSGRKCAICPSRTAKLLTSWCEPPEMQPGSRAA